MYKNEFQDYELLIDENILRKIQARWRGAIVRKRITSVRQEYELIFSEIEETPSCCIEWRGSCIRRPQFELLDRRIKVHHNKDQHGNKTSQQTSDCISLADQDSAKSTNDKLYVSDSKVESHTKTECISDSSGTLDQHVDSVNTLPAGDSQQVVSTLQSPEINTEHLTVHIDEIKPGDGRLPAENIDDKLTAIENVQLVGSSLEEKRHNLALELLWIQQAIHSRKQYLRLKSQIVDQDNK